MFRQKAGDLCSDTIRSYSLNTWLENVLIYQVYGLCCKTEFSSPSQLKTQVTETQMPCLNPRIIVVSALQGSPCHPPLSLGFLFLLCPSVCVYGLLRMEEGGAGTGHLSSQGWKVGQGGAGEEFVPAESWKSYLEPVFYSQFRRHFVLWCIVLTGTRKSGSARGQRCRWFLPAAAQVGSLLVCFTLFVIKIIAALSHFAAHPICMKQGRARRRKEIPVSLFFFISNSNCTYFCVKGKMLKLTS